MEEYLAHIAQDGRRQSVRSHLENTAALAGDFAGAFGSAEWGRLCGLGHDLGKYSPEFQRRIRGSSQQVDHATLGAQVLLGQAAVPAAFCVAGHHGGLPDGGSTHDPADLPTLFGRMKRSVPDAGGWRSEITLPPTPPMPAGIKDPVAQAFFARMLYSCLVDADYLDTEAFMNGTPPRAPGGPSIDLLAKRLDAYLEGRGFLRPGGPLNARRAEVLRACIDAGGRAPGLFSLTVPTGGGKTVSSLAFALNHARRHGMRRVIYVAPFCAIIDQTAEEFRKILGEDCVLEHHSAAEHETGADGYLTAKGSRALLAAENWDMPVVVTTAVQFFESLYSCKSSKCRKLHNMANSVIIFDEAQTLPVSCLRPCVSAIGQLAMHYHSSAVLCTATQPALGGLLEELAPGLEKHELCPDVPGIFGALRRTTIVREGVISNSRLAQRLAGHRQVLCIVNSR